jgi:hypothetical protein
VWDSIEGRGRQKGGISQGLGDAAERDIRRKRLGELPPLWRHQEEVHIGPGRGGLGRCVFLAGGEKISLESKMRQRQREREREKDRQRKTDRERKTDRDRDRDRDRQTDRDRDSDRQTETDRDRQRDGQRGREGEKERQRQRQTASEALRKEWPEREDGEKAEMRD